MKVHRAATLVLLVALATVLAFAMTSYGISTYSGRGLVALAVVVAGTGLAGTAFSYWAYYLRRR